MSDLFPKLTNPPIVEVVLDFECDLPPSFDLKALEQPARERFESCYPLVQPRFMQEFLVEMKSDGTTNSSARHGLRALMFRKSDNTQLVQVRTAGFSFNRLVPYTKLDAYLQEIQRVWNLYREIAQPIVVRGLKLRYINRILIPFEASPVDFGKYLKLQNMLADDKRLTLTGFLNQYSAVDRETKHQVTVILTEQFQEGDKLPIIFDNAASANVEIDPDDWDGLLVTLKSLQELKNVVFFQTVTKQCLELFG